MDSKPETSKLIASFAAIYLIWGTTYLAVRVAVETFPPFMMAAGRFLIAGFVLLGVLVLAKVKLPTFRQWRYAFVIGAFLFVGGNGLVTWAEKDIPSGIAALVVATMPLWMTLFDWLLFGGPRPTLRTTIGMVLGLFGIILLTGPSELLNGTSEFKASSMIGLLMAPIFWSIGSLYSRVADLPKNTFMTNAAEMICGGFLLIVASLLCREHVGFALSSVSRESWLATGYLMIFGSMIALTAYAWLLKNAEPAKVSTYSYVNPVIAVVLGWLILKEQLTETTLIAVIVIITGVMIVVTDRTAKKSKIEPVTNKVADETESDPVNVDVDPVDSATLALTKC